MIVIGMGLGWVGYALAWRGFALVKGWNLSTGQIISPTKYYKGAWPPPLAPDTAIFPTGKAASTTGDTSSPAPSTKPGAAICPPGYYKPLNSGKCVKIATD